MAVDPNNPFGGGSTAKQPQGLSDRAAAALQGLAQKVGQANIPGLIDYIAALPAEQVINLLGAPERVISERTSNFKANPRGVAETSIPFLDTVAIADPKGREEIGHEIYAAFHPNDPSIEARSEQATGVNKLISSDPRFRGKLQNFLVRTAFQNVKDPLNWATAGIASAGEIGLRALGRAGTRALLSPDETIRKTAKTMLTNVAEREGGFSDKEISTVNSLRQRGITQARVQHTADEALLHANRKELAKGIMPDAVRQRLLQEPYVFGTPEMREQALKFGYKPTAKEATQEPLNLLDYNLRENYDPQTGMMKQHSFDDLLLGQTEHTKPPTAGFEKQQTGIADVGTLSDGIAKRLSTGRNVIRHRSTAAGLEEHLGVSPEMANSLASDEQVGGFPLGQAISKAQVDAMLATGIPHMRNVGVMGWNALGEGGLGRAMYLTMRPDKKLIERLEQGGASHFGIRTPGKFSPARLIPLPVRRATTGLLDKWDQGLRAARLEQLDKEMPGLSEFEKLDRVNQDLGPYNLKPQYVKVLQSVGANFPQWHNYVVPTAVGRAIVRHPGRVTRLARAEQNANDTFLPNAPYRVTLGGPNDEFAKMAADPASMAAGKGAPYLLSPSSVGPLFSMLMPSRVAGKNYGQRAAQTASNFIPLGGPALDVLMNPYKSPLPPLPRAAAGVTGVYTQRRPPQSMARTATRAAAPTTFDPANPFGGGAKPEAQGTPAPSAVNPANPFGGSP